MAMTEQILPLSGAMIDHIDSNVVKSEDGIVMKKWGRCSLGKTSRLALLNFDHQTRASVLVLLLYFLLPPTNHLEITVGPWRDLSSNYRKKIPAVLDA